MAKKGRQKGKMAAVTKASAAPKPSSMDVNISDGKNRLICPELLYWFSGAIFSALPLIVINGIIDLKDTSGTFIWFKELFQEEELLFIYISVLISAIFELYSQKRNRDLLLIFILMTILALSLIYGIVKWDIYTSGGTCSYSICGVNVVCLVITAVLGFATFIKKRS